MIPLSGHFWGGRAISVAAPRLHVEAQQAHLMRVRQCLSPKAGSEKGLLAKTEASLAHSQPWAHHAVQTKPVICMVPTHQKDFNRSLRGPQTSEDNNCGRF